jgi:hypothetical protein
MSDWLPGRRAAILAMCRNWISMMATPETRTRWGVPTDRFQRLGTLFGTAQALLQKAEDEAERTHVVTVEVQNAFAVLTADMRDFRDRYFKIPPLTLGEWAALGFREKDTEKTTVQPPTGIPLVSLSYPSGPHVLRARLGPLPGTEDLNTGNDFGYAIYVGIMPPGGATLEEAASDKHYLRAPPRDGKGLNHYRFTHRRNERLVFDAEDAGKTAYVCSRYENGKGEVGEWGPVASAIIP